MPLDSSSSNNKTKRKKRKRTFVIQTLDPGANATTQEGFLDFFRSLIDAFIPDWTRGGPASSLSRPTGTSESILSQEQDPGEEGQSSMADVAEMGAPMLPAILFIASLILLGVSFFTGNISGSLKSMLFSTEPANVMMPTVRVWVNKENGTFYCDGSVLYGDGQGQFMRQAEALNLGYQPSLGKYCQPGKSEKPAAEKRVRRPRRASTVVREPPAAKFGEPATSSPR